MSTIDEQATINALGLKPERIEQLTWYANQRGGDLMLAIRELIRGPVGRAVSDPAGSERHDPRGERRCQVMGQRTGLKGIGLGRCDLPLVWHHTSSVVVQHVSIGDRLDL